MERQKVGAILKDLFKAELGKLTANLLNVLTENNRVCARTVFSIFGAL